MNKYFLDGLRVLAKNTNPNRPVTINELIRVLEMAIREEELDNLNAVIKSIQQSNVMHTNNNLHVVACVIEGKSKVYFTGSYDDCVKYMMSTPDPWYESDNAAIHLADEWEVDYT